MPVKYLGGGENQIKTNWNESESFGCISENESSRRDPK